MKPCQPFSAAGRRKGTTDERHLWPYFAEAIRVLRPRYVVLENVAGHRSMGFDRVLADLAGLRYDAQWCSLRASDVGAPHRRERLFVIAHPEVAERGGPQQQHLGASTFAASEPRERAGTVKLLTTPRHSDAGPRGGTTGFGLRNWTRDYIADLLPTPTGRDGKGANQRGDDTCLTGALLPTPAASDCTGGGQHPSKRVGHSQQLIDYVLLCTPSVADGDGGHLNRSGDHNTELLLPGQAREMATNWGKYEPAIRRWETLTRPAPPPTEPNTKGNPRLSAAFSEWLMGWPVGWVTDVPGISRNDALRIIGNGVVPQQAVAALSWLLWVSEEAA